jgi:TetR/AcrR family transcriptional regulator
VSAAIAAAPTAWDGIEAYVRALVGYMSSNPAHMRLLVEVLVTGELGDAGSAPELVSSPAPRWAVIAALMTKAQQDGDLRPFDVRTGAIALSGAIDAIFAETLTDPQYDLQAAVDQLIELTWAATRRRAD